MPKIEVKEEVKTKKKSTAVDKKEKTKKIVNTEKGKAKETKSTKKVKVKEEKPKVVKAKKTTVKEEKPKEVKAKKVESKKANKTTTKVAAKISKKTTTKKSVTKKTKTKAVKKVETKTFLPEYYDLPYRYNDTLVRILYQTPKRIFVYWDVSDSDRQRYINAFGEDFYEKTYPVLLVHNENMNYTFEVQINDFANSWYIDINDSKSKYIVQLGRKFKEIQKEQIDYKVVEEEQINLQNDYIYITHSNKLETPNDKVLFEKVPEKITFRNVKTGEITYKETKQVLRKISKVYNDPKVEDIYREMYGEEILTEEKNILLNPSSGNSSSFFK